MAGITGGSKQQRLIRRFYSAFQEEVAITATATDLSLPSVTVAGISSGATVTRAIAVLIPRVIENTNAAANKLSGAQNIQVRVSSGSWSDAIAVVDDLFGLAASTREGGSPLLGQTDIKAVVTGDGTYDFQWEQAIADVANLNFNDVQMMLEVEWSV